MRIAVLAPICWRTPPLHYGPWEQIASNIAEGFVEKGFDVTLFATANSQTKGKLEAVCGTAYEENKELDAKVWECLHISHLMQNADHYDIIHNNYDFLPLSYSRLIHTPMVTTIHGFSSPKIIPVYKEYNDNNYYVSISNSDRSPELEYVATVYNGIKVADFSFNEFPEDYLLFFGRIHPDKGTSEAIEIAEKSGKKLIIAGIVQDAEYFKQKIKPCLNENAVFIGEAGPLKRNSLLGKACALLHPIKFNEPFGLSVAESMLCGTPVIAFNRRSMPELIQHGKTGYLVETVDEAVQAVDNVKEINRHECRDWSMKKFSQEKMIEDYLNVYKAILEYH
ncbi:MAG: glycosyltransferase family 4 protein [Leptospiraceae bacterium]|nr:glycosyltransferase family 4 protein [Leptospiraceae bacterium]